MNYKISEKYLKKVFETNTDYTEWFGYYNYDVVSEEVDKMLCNRATFDGRDITDKDVIEVGYYDISTKKWHKLGETDSFNWQQGAMLQWINGTKSVIYNFSNKEKFFSKIINLENGQSKVLDFPIYQIAPDGKTAIALKYERSYWCRAYHYKSVVNKDLDVRVDQTDGVFKVDLQSGKVNRIIDINDVINIDKEEDFDEAKHWLEHVMISPSGKRICFLHRYTYGQAYLTRLFIADYNGENLQIVPGWKTNDWSHFGWNGDDKFVIYSVQKSESTANYIKKALKGQNKRSVRSIVAKITNLPVLKQIKAIIKPKRSQYYLEYEISENKITQKTKHDDKLFNVDGHPSFTKDGQYMITDSYPDKKGYQRLIVYNLKNKKALLLGKFFAYYKGNPASCDLHPKLSRNNQYVAVDTACSGKHKMMLFSLNWDEIKEKLK
jgi:hypothetical protein